MSTVEEIVAAIKDLPPEKRDEVRRQLASLWWLTARESAGHVEDADYNNRMNLHSTKPSPTPTKRTRPRRPPIKIKGKPLSETVVEDRR
jgi:hypothetical protein